MSANYQNTANDCSLGTIDSLSVKFSPKTIFLMTIENREVLCVSVCLLGFSVLIRDTSLSKNVSKKN